MVSGKGYVWVPMFSFMAYVFHLLGCIFGFGILGD
jgi:hypothetical protein